MDKFLQHLEEMLELAPGTLNPDTPLSQIPTWDSMAAVGFLALADGTYNTAVSPANIQKCKTVNELSLLVGVK
jgi:acyl carrier protein